jgi:hypothetical protein
MGTTVPVQPSSSIFYSLSCPAGLKDTHKGFLNHTPQIFWSNQLPPMRSFSSLRSKCHSTFAIIKRISARARLIPRQLRVPMLQGWKTGLLSSSNSDGASSSQRSGQNSIDRWKFLGSWQAPIIDMPTLTWSQSQLNV